MNFPAYKNISGNEAFELGQAPASPSSTPILLNGELLWREQGKLAMLAFLS
ncbi:MAG: hypothetical protein HN435_14180 [Nitrospinaceae bacterium]|nr:hypothetical protein [Nitrospinaceae bacterium]